MLKGRNASLFFFKDSNLHSDLTDLIGKTTAPVPVEESGQLTQGCGLVLRE